MEIEIKNIIEKEMRVYRDWLEDLPLSQRRCFNVLEDMYKSIPETIINAISDAGYTIVKNNEDESIKCDISVKEFKPQLMKKIKLTLGIKGYFYTTANIPISAYDIPPQVIGERLIASAIGMIARDKSQEIADKIRKQLEATDGTT